MTAEETTTSKLGIGFWLLLSLAVALIAIMVAGIWFATSGSEQQAKAEQEEIAELAELASMAVEPGLTDSEDAASVKDRNALIPVSGDPLEAPAGIFRLAADHSAYKSALRCMTEAVYYEAANESLQGKRGVAQVILNRLKHPAYPNSVCGVVYEGSNKRVCQFSFTCDGSLLRKPMARQWITSRAVAAASLSGTREPSVGTATHYHADYVLPYWAHKLAKVQVVGTHIFYRFNGRWGSSSAFSKAWSGRETIPQIDYARFEKALEEGDEVLLAEMAEIETVPGLTVTPDVTDRHAAADVGGRIDTTVAWRPSIPDPTTGSTAFRAALEEQGAPTAKQTERVADLALEETGTPQ
ncbi:cell wall hydrolase [Altererythrobacter sp. ZODW24]|uniref:cell wall hydrolase n=1 Tax=Altererythrobacter sp. ZODW24 TaxID=2185142 RepID=UPI000DF846AE|nr:cell wall hydrolase [Altererythrobacter sp. ZODW24]